MIEHPCYRCEKRGKKKEAAGWLEDVPLCQECYDIITAERKPQPGDTIPIKLNIKEE